MRHSWVLVGAVLLMSCQSQASREEQKYGIVAKGSDAQAKCDQGKKVAAAYLDAGDQANYSTWKLRSDIDCTTASLDRTPI